MLAFSYFGKSPKWPLKFFFPSRLTPAHKRRDHNCSLKLSPYFGTKQAWNEYLKMFGQIMQPNFCGVWFGSTLSGLPVKRDHCSIYIFDQNTKWLASTLRMQNKLLEKPLKQKHVCAANLWKERSSLPMRYEQFTGLHLTMLKIKAKFRQLINSCLQYFDHQYILGWHSH